MSLKAINPSPRSASDSKDIGSPSAVRDTDLGPAQEKVRKYVALALVCGLLVVVGAYVVVGMIGAQACWTHPDCAKVGDAMAVIREFLGTALASITGLVGAVTGFYFGSKAAKG